MCAYRIHINAWLLCLVLYPFTSTSPVCAQSQLLLLDKGSYHHFDIEIRKTLSDTLAMRLSMFDGEGVYSKRERNLQYQNSIHNQTHLTTLDWHPFKRHFRTSVGLAVRHHSWNIMVQPFINQAASSRVFDLEKINADQQYRFEGSTIILDRSRIESFLNLANSVGITFNFDLDQLPESLNISGGVLEIDKGVMPDYYTVDIPALSLSADEINIVADMRFRQFSPYVGIGWGTPPTSDNSLQYSIDLGLIYHGTPSINLLLNGEFITIDSRLTARLENLRLQKQHELQQTASRYPILPYLSFGLRVPF